MKKGVTLDEIAELLSARINLQQRQYLLWRARTRGEIDGAIRYFEGGVKVALDRVWEAQQRAA